jgi:uracil-DNA glycosylase
VRELDLIRPSYLLVLGQMTSQILYSDLGVPPVRSQWNFYQGIPFIATCSPSEAMRGQDIGRIIFDDLRSIKRRIEKEKEWSQDELAQSRHEEIQKQERLIAQFKQEHP